MNQNIVQWAGQQDGKTMGDALSLSSNGKFGRADLDANNNINAYSTSHALAIASAFAVLATQAVWILPKSSQLSGVSQIEDGSWPASISIFSSTKTEA